MTTKKYCAKCERVVDWQPPQDRRLENCIITHITCVGGNEPWLCGKIARQKQGWPTQ